MNEPGLIRSMLGEPNRTIAVVGISDVPSKPSFYVSAYMQQQGYRILPVNPQLTTVHGEPAFASLADLPVRPDIVNVFRLPKAIPEIVQQMIALDLKNLWVQLGIVNLEAAAMAEAAGIRVVMDHCIMLERRALAGV